jgi:hypothetical protein
MTSLVAAGRFARTLSSLMMISSGADIFSEPQQREISGVIASSKGLRGTPSVSWIKSFEPIEKPSKRSAKAAARMAFEGISHIT